MTDEPTLPYRAPHVPASVLKVRELNARISEGWKIVAQTWRDYARGFADCAKWASACGNVTMFNEMTAAHARATANAKRAEEMAGGQS